MPAARKRLCNKRFRQAVRGMQTNEVTFAHARGEKTSVQRAFSPSLAGMPTKEVTFEHARGEQKAEPSLHHRAHRPHRPTGVEAGWVFAAGRCQK